MTFEQWWAKIYFRTDEEKQRLRSSYADCWNAAIDAEEAQTIITAEKVSVQILPSIRARVTP